jgi:hypothetical protein
VEGAVNLGRRPPRAFRSGSLALSRIVSKTNLINTSKMKEIIVKTQNELDRIDLGYDGYIYIEGGTTDSPLTLKTNFEQAYVIIRGSAYVESVYGNATVEYVSGNATVKSVSGNATVEYVYGNATVKSVYDNATVKSVYDNATVKSVSGNATVKSVYDNATVEYVSGNATVKSVYDNATVEYVYGNATVEYVSGNATVKSVYDNATVEYVSGNATLTLFGEAVITKALSAKKIVLNGYNTIVVHKSDKKRINLVMNKESNLVILPDNTLATKPTFKEFAMRYGIQVNGSKAILYKAVHKKDGRYFAEYVKTFEYKIGDVQTETCDPVSSGACSRGLHLSPKYWAFNFGRSWEDLAILECEVATKDVIVSNDTDGKVRTPKLKVLRELNTPVSSG